MLKLFLILIALPLVVVLGHDIYMFTQHQDKGFMLSDLGFLWTTYHPESFKQVNQSVDEQSWALINALLTQKASLIFGIFTAVIYLITWGIVTLAKGKEAKINNMSYLKSKKGQIKYKRK